MPSPWEHILAHQDFMQAGGRPITRQSAFTTYGLSTAGLGYTAHWKTAPTYQYPAGVLAAPAAYTVPGGRPFMEAKGQRPRGGLGWMQSVARKREGQLERGYKPTFVTFPEQYGGLGISMSMVTEAEQNIAHLRTAARKASTRLVPSTYSRDLGMYSKVSEAMQPDILQPVLQQVLNRPRKYIGGAVGRPDLVISPVSGIQIMGQGVEGLRLPTFYGPFAFGLPRGVTRAGQMRGVDYRGTAQGLMPVSGTAKFPMFVAQRRAMVTSGGHFTLEMPSKPILEALGRGLENVWDERNPIAVQKEVNKAMTKMLRYEGTPYAAWFQQYMHEVHYETGRAGDYVSLESRLRARDKEIMEKYPDRPATAIHKKPEMYLEELRRVEEKAGTGLYFGVSKVESLLKHGMLSSRPLEELAPFGAYADPARPWIQTTRRGQMLAASVEATPSSLAGGRKTIPYLSSYQGAMAEELQRSMTGAPSSIQARVAMVLEEAGRPSFFGGINTPHGEVLLGDKFALNFTRDLTANTMLQKAGHRAVYGGIGSRVQMPVWDPTKITSGESFFMSGTKVTQRGRFAQMGGLKDVDAIMSMIPMHKKIPHEFRSAIAGSVIEQMGPLHTGRRVQKIQKQFMNAFAKSFAAPGKKASPTVRWMTEKGGKKELASILFPGGERFDFGKTAETVKWYNENMKRVMGAGFTPITPGFTVEDIPVPDFETMTWKMRPAMIVAMETSLREHSHMVEGMLGAVGPSVSGYAEPGIHGVKLTKLMSANIWTMNKKVGQRWTKMMEVMAKKAPANKETLGELASIIAPLLGSKSQAYVPQKPEGVLSWVFKVGERAQVPAELAELKALPRGKITSLEQLTGTLFDPKSPLWKTGLAVDVEGMLPMRQGGLAVKQIYIPKLEMFNSWIKHAERTGDIHPLPVMRRISEVFQALKELGPDTRGGLHDPKLKKSVMGYLHQVAEDVGGKEGWLRRLMEPKIAGSGHFALIGASETPKIFAGMPAQFGDVIIDEATAKAMGAYDRLKKAGKSGIYGMLAAYPEQAFGNTAFTRFVMMKNAPAGALAATKDFATAMYRDTDYDRVGAILNPFKDPKEIAEFEDIAKAGYESQIEQYKRGELTGAKAINEAKKMQTEMEKLSSMYRSPRELAQLFSTEESTITRLAEGLKEGNLAKFEEALEKAPGALAALWANEGIKAGFAGHMFGRVATTKMTTGNVVKAYMRVRKITEEIGRIEGASNLAVRNTNIAIGHWIQEGTIEKAQTAKIRLFELIESYNINAEADSARGVFKKGILDYLTDTHKTAQRSGWRFIPPKAGQAVNLGEVADLITEGIVRAKKSGELAKADIFEQTIGSTMDFLSREDKLETMVDMAGTQMQGAGEMELRTKAGRAAVTEAGFVMPAGVEEPLSDAAMAAHQMQLDIAEQQLNKTRDAMESKTHWETVTAPFKRAWDWFKRGPAGPADKFYNMKRAGVVAGGLLLGGAVLKSFLTPGIAPEVPRESSYVDMAGPMGDFVGNPNHPVVMGRGMGGFAKGVPPIMPMGMDSGAPVPPPMSGSWNVSSPPALTMASARMETSLGLPSPSQESMVSATMYGIPSVQQDMPTFSSPEFATAGLTSEPRYDIVSNSEIIATSRGSIRRIV